MDRQYPDKETAHKQLQLGGTLNPGPWVGHSIHTGLACSYIAKRSDNLDPEKAYILGAMHDIGRREGVTSMRHILDGYNYCISNGWEDVAKICMTHSFMIQNPDTEIGRWDVSQQERDFIYSYIPSVTYDDYDKLVQLADSLALEDGFCILEKRFVDVTRRYGFAAYTIDRWNATFEIKRYFEDIIGCSIYDLFEVKN